MGCVKVRSRETAWMAHRVGQGQSSRLHGHVVLDHGQDQRRGPELQEGRHLGQVGVAHDDVETPVPVGVGVGLVPGVHQRPLQRRLQPHLLLEELGSLGDLEVHRPTVVRRRLRPHLSRPAVQLAGDEMGNDRLDDAGEGGGPVHQVILVAAVRVALAVRVVLVDDQAATIVHGPVGGLHGALDDELAGPVVEHALEGIGALGGGELGVGVIDVEPGAVGQNRVDQMGLDLWGHRTLAGLAPGVVARGLIFEVPADLLAGDLIGIGVDQDRRSRDGIRVAVRHVNAVFSLNSADLGNGHERDPIPAATSSNRPPSAPPPADRPRPTGQRY